MTYEAAMLYLIVGEVWTLVTLRGPRYFAATRRSHERRFGRAVSLMITLVAMTIYVLLWPAWVLAEIARET